MNDWQDRLAEYLNRLQSRPFHWATHSCLTFATGAVTAMTGEDYWAGERARLLGLGRRGHVIRYMHRYGGNLEGAADKALALAGARRSKCPGEGDIVLARVGDAVALGVCLGRLFAFISPDGIVRSQPDHVVATWRVG